MYFAACISWDKDILKCDYINEVRKSSCVTARGLLPAAYQAVALLSWQGGQPLVQAGVPQGRTWDRILDRTSDRIRGYPQERTWDQRLGVTSQKGPGTKDWGNPL